MVNKAPFCKHCGQPMYSKPMKESEKWCCAWFFCDSCKYAVYHCTEPNPPLVESLKASAIEFVDLGLD